MTPALVAVIEDDFEFDGSRPGPSLTGNDC